MHMGIGGNPAVDEEAPHVLLDASGESLMHCEGPLGKSPLLNIYSKLAYLDSTCANQVTNDQAGAMLFPALIAKVEELRNARNHHWDEFCRMHSEVQELRRSQANH